MTETERKILDNYAQKAALFKLEYQLMGLMLDNERFLLEIKKRGWKEIYIYGGAYLGISAFQVLKKNYLVKAIIDKRKKLAIPINDVKVYDVNEFRDIYNGEPIIITPIEYIIDIKKELLHFANESELVGINELF